MTAAAGDNTQHTNTGAADHTSNLRAGAALSATHCPSRLRTASGW